MNALLSLLLQLLLLLLLSRDMDLAIERSDDGDNNAAIAKECGTSLKRCVASGLSSPLIFSSSPPFLFPFGCPSVQKKEQNERKERKRLSR
jgi:hypothetical protein